MLLYICLLLFAASSALAQDTQLADRAAAILRERCAQCHGDAVAMAGLRLLSRDQVLKGGTHGPTVAPGNARGSRLFQAITRAIEPAMPPGKPLASEEVETLRAWIDAGAPWPDRKTWWAFIPPKRPAVPDVSDAWVRSPIDAFILAKLTSQS